VENGVRAGRTIPLGGKQWQGSDKLSGGLGCGCGVHTSERVKGRKMTPLDRSFSLAEGRERPAVPPGLTRVAQLLSCELKSTPDSEI
jgi:hypothetical protein